MRRIGILLCVLANLTIANSVHASTDATVRRAPKSKRTARMLALGSTILPIALGIALTTSESEPMDELGVFLIGSGIIIGPGVGQAYADRPVRFAAGAIVRTLCLWLSAVAVILETVDGNDSENGTTIAVLTGLGGYTFSAVYDITTVGGAVDDYNRKHVAPAFSIGPVYNPRDKTPGLAFTFRF